MSSPIQALLVRDTRSGRLIHHEARAAAVGRWARLRQDLRESWLRVRYPAPRYEVASATYDSMETLRRAESAAFSRDGGGSSMAFGPWDPPDL